MDWFPRMRAMSLDSYDKDDEDSEINYLKNRLDATNTLVVQLSKQIEELSEKVFLFFYLFFYDSNFKSFIFKDN